MTDPLHDGSLAGAACAKVPLDFYIHSVQFSAT
jgi:hypothetical protein